ncbi:GNAT family N-acetyltransferase [Enterococcus sp. HY326]|uniref:GNAT family N-acetyltransferase n=1 Tax=Enterococcus sp. HY326 TaxID=2971265 RepID=UPI00223F94CD|nr:GNAT family N-acetyltransferase [Enterococcus sp. HY326]
MNELENTKVKLKIEVPKRDEYLALRKSGGLSTRSLAGAEIGLANSLYSVCLREAETDKLIGMGRIIGDGGTSYQIVDIVVDPLFQQQGLGKLIMKHLMVYITEEADAQAYISLIADGKASKLYEQFGFIETKPQSSGMYYKR